MKGTCRQAGSELSKKIEWDDMIFLTLGFERVPYLVGVAPICFLAY
jgi:hypothetical protein